MRRRVMVRRSGQGCLLTLLQWWFLLCVVLPAAVALAWFLWAMLVLQ
jgi:hypothetical protein